MVNIDNLKKRMSSALDTLLRDFSGLRTGRASVNLLDHVTAEVYGSRTPISQLGNISVVDTKMLLIQIWDKSAVKPIELAIQNSSLGVSTQIEGTSIRVIIPALSEERRKEICKLASKYSEQTKVSIRNVRRDGMDDLKKCEKAKEISEDESKKVSAEIQKITDDFVKKVDEALAVKEKEILKI